MGYQRPFLLLSFLVASTLAQVCVFQNTALTQGLPWTTSTATAVSACFNAVPFNTTTRSATIAQLQNLINLYSFTDISANSPAPYNLQVDLAGGLKTIGATTYASDFQFHIALYNLFNGLGDAHTLYFPPTPYLNFLLVRPFAFKSTVDQNGKQIILTVAETALNGPNNAPLAYNQFTGVQVANFVNQQVTAINGMDPIQYILSVGNRMGTSKDQGARFNNGLANFQLTPAIQSDFLLNETYTIGGQTVTLPLFYIVEQLYNGLKDFETNIPFNAANTCTKRQTSSYVPRELRKEQRDRRDRLLASSDSSDSSKRAVGDLTLVAASLENAAVCSTMTDRQNNQVAVLKISTFAPVTANPTTWTTSLVTTIETCVTNAQQNNIQNLILDVIDNGGGIICAQYAAQVALFQNLNPALNNDLWDPYDEKEGTINTALFNLNFRMGPAQFLNASIVPATVDTTTTYYSSPVSSTRGGLTDNYTQKVYFPSACQTIVNQYETQGTIINQNYNFAKVITLTDGLCGSACSQFASKLRYYGLTATVGMGGILTQPMESSSFTGGNVEDWTAFVTEVACYNANLLQQLPTSAFTRFNYAEFYLGNQPLPREFQRIQPDYRVTNWNIAKPDYLDTADAFYNGAITWPVAPLGTHFTVGATATGTGIGDLNTNGNKIETMAPSGIYGSSTHASASSLVISTSLILAVIAMLML